MFHLDTTKIINPPLSTDDYTSVNAYNGNIDHSLYVLKTMDAHSTHELALFLQPLVLGSNHNHPNILPICGYDLHDNTDRILSQKIHSLHVLFPRVAGSLSDKVNRHINEELGSVPKEEVISHLYDIVKGLEYLQSRNIAHMNIKPGNVLLNSKGRAMLSDIGLIRVGDKYHRVDKTYVAPELRSKKLEQVDDLPELNSGDAWSLGMTIFYLCTLGNTNKKHGSLSPHGKDFQKQMDAIEKKYGEDLKEILERLLDDEPGRRYGFTELRKHLERNYKGLDREEIEEERGSESRRASQSTARSEREKRQSRGLESSGKREQEAGNVGRQSQRSEASQHSQQKRAEKHEKESEGGMEIEHEKRTTHSKVLEDFHPIKSELGEKWREFFKLPEGDEWSVKVKDPVKMTDTEIDIFLFDVSEKFKDFDTSTIERIDYDFTNCTRITDKGLGHIGINIAQNFASSTTVNLGFGGWDQITNKGLSQLIGHIANNLHEVQELSIDLSYWIRITDESFSDAIAEISQNLKHLTNLTLDLSYTNITDKAITQIVTYIGHRLPELENLVLRFGGCFHVTDAGLGELAKQLSRNLKSLKQLELGYGFCMSITDKGLIELANHIPSRLTELQYMSLDFGGCCDITDKGVTELATHIAQHMKDLQSLSLDFEGCTSVSDKPKSLLKQTLSFIPRISIK